MLTERAVVAVAVRVAGSIVMMLILTIPTAQPFMVTPRTVPVNCSTPLTRRA